MSQRAKVAGAAGTIVDGRIRDLHEHRELGYPVGAIVYAGKWFDTMATD
jgi:regulator of RNase E activity RraA